MDIIYAYTRKEAIADGMQKELNPATVKEAGIVFPVYVTSSIQNIIDKAVKNERYCNDEDGIVWDILTMLKYAIKTSTKTNDIYVTVTIVGAGRKKNYSFLAQIGPNDINDSKPAITIMFPEER